MRYTHTYNAYIQSAHLVISISNVNLVSVEEGVGGGGGVKMLTVKNKCHHWPLLQDGFLR